ncbi:Metallo-dependent phosphatase [Xylariaceae sp. AK1471]|nr:Metallo-dependent phosphatase [Xylariaceae sp. AK1471]
MADDKPRRNQRMRKRNLTRPLPLTFVLGGIVFVLCIVFLSYMRLTPIPLPLPLALRPVPNETNIAAMATTTKPTRKSYPQIITLPTSLLPTARDKRRLIIIGDVHGHLKALQALLEKAKFSTSRGDTVIFTGDTVNKGADSAGVVDLAMKIGAFSVRGNHEDRVLGAWERERGRDRGRHTTSGEEGEAEEEMERRTKDLVLSARGSATVAKLEAAQEHGDNEGTQGDRAEEDSSKSKSQSPKHQQKLNESEKERGKDKNIEVRKSHAADLATATSLKPRHRAWLSALPLILRVGDLGPRYGEVVVVHAGLVPGIPLESQDPDAVMTMRTLLPAPHSRTHSADHEPEPQVQDQTQDEQTRRQINQAEGNSKPKFKSMIPSPLHDGVPWAKAWTSYQKSLPHHHAPHTTVVYGHDSKAGLKMRKYAFGLDSGCGKGNTLTGVIFEAVPHAANATDDVAEEDGEDGEDVVDEDVEGNVEDGDVEDVEDIDELDQESQKKGKKAPKKGLRIRHRLVSVSCEEVAQGGKSGRPSKHLGGT